MAYHGDVRFLENCSPELIERNAAEFTRMRDLLVSAEPPVNKARYHTDWESAHRPLFDARLTDAGNLVSGLSDGFGKAGTALLRYADEVGRAKQHLANGLVAEGTLDELISTVATPVTRTAQQAEPMHRWEDIRETTGFLDGVAELGVDVDSIREQATRAYEQADDAFGRAKSIEEAAREQCLAELNAAYSALPDFRGGDFARAADVAGSITPLLDESVQARADPYVQLPGSGLKDGGFPLAGAAAVSPVLQYIRTRLMSLPAASGSWLADFLPGGNRDWITNNKELIAAAARETRLPPDLIAGIAWREVGGKPYLADDAAEFFRRAAEHPLSPVTPENLPYRLAGDKDDTSYGPMAVQLRRGAEVLGYDPDNLNDGQRDEIRSALKDPAQNIFIAAKHLANLKAETGFADVPAEHMTPAQYEELAARYNGGPNWQSATAQDYGHDFITHLGEAREALR